MLPRVILHNSVSLDGSLTGFEPEMALHYRIAAGYHPEATLIGSRTVEKGIELFGQGVPPEEQGDFERPGRDGSLPYWVIIDSRGALHGLLHSCRRFEYCRDVVILVSGKTPKEYLAYLEERKYRHHVAGTDHVDLNQALELLSDTYGARTVLTDTGQILGNLLLDQGLLAEISLLVHPVIVGARSYPIFGGIAKSPKLRLKHSEVFAKDHLWQVYEVGQ
ncbi:MAG: 5-amino-6-(5-phosphoribosylamino)uracil reductase [Methanoregulaceae archaeon]|nr:5-amino-6-(5-phosphoribosylamino)uracil reductase [Methanoregulaceae archaeon]